MKRLSSTPEFSVVTPSYNMLPYLKRACASVAGQDGVEIEHIVVDAVSDDGSVEWLKSNGGVACVVEKDKGMYDAVNKGWGRAKGAIVSYLNCDEQYLPGALAAVREFFQRRPDVDLLFGDALLIRPDGSLISYRKGYRARWPFILSSHLYVLSCTMFLRRRLIEQGCRFDDRLKDIGDQDLVVRLLRNGCRTAHIRRYIAAFTMTGQNMSASQNARRERRAALAAAPLWVRCLKYPLNAARLTAKAFSGAYHQKMPLRYAVFASDDASERTVFQVTNASFRWRAG